MRKLLTVTFFLIAAVGYAKNPHPLDCEVEAYNTKSDKLNLVCPPLFDFSPIRIEISLGKIDAAGWTRVDLQGLTPAKVMQRDPGKFLVRLPHQEGSHHWLAWREFDKVNSIFISRDNLK